MRVAWFSPWPPQSSGIAGRSAEIVPHLAARGLTISVFVDHRHVPVARVADDQPPTPGTVRVESAHDFVWRAARGQFDLTVYQVGNSRRHEYLWPYLFRWPGLTVFHDARLHHARGAALLGRRRHADYRRELAFDHPDAAVVAELGIAGFDGAYYYLWPMTRAVVAASRLAAVHAAGARADLAVSAGVPEAALATIALGEGRAVPVPDTERRRWRARQGLDETTVVFGLFGGLTRDKRVAEVLRAFATIRTGRSKVHLILAGATDGRLDPVAIADTLGIGQRVTILPPPDDETFDCAIAAVDVTINLRWPSALEMSGPWLRALAAGRPTITTALPHLSAVPALDPQTWLPRPGTGAAPPVTVSVDILDEAHSLRRAMARLADDGDLRTALGKAARAYWEREHTVSRMADDYLRAIERAALAPPPAEAIPAVCRPDPLEHTEALLRPFGGLISCTLR